MHTHKTGLQLLKTRINLKLCFPVYNLIDENNDFIQTNMLNVYLILTSKRYGTILQQVLSVTNAKP
jgi:hypothetical protein